MKARLTDDLPGQNNIRKNWVKFYTTTNVLQDKTTKQILGRTELSVQTG